MMTQRKFTKWISKSLIACAILLGSVVGASAENTEMPRLIEVTNNVAHTGDTLVFSIDYGQSLGLGLQSSNIAYVEWNLGDGTIVRNSGLEALVHIYDVPGTYMVRVTVRFASLFGSPSNRSISSTEKLVIEHSQSSGLALSGGAAQVIEGFDADKNDRLSNSEFFRIVDSWIQGSVPDGTFFAAIDLWISDSSILSMRAAAAESLTPRVSRGAGNAVIFSAGAGHYSNLIVKIFDADGHFITQQRSDGHQLRWNALDDNGNRLSNGVYFYALSAYDSEGLLAKSVLKPFYLMR